MEEWDLSEKKVYDVCKVLGIEKNEEGQYIIPEMKKPYYPDKRKFAHKDAGHLYIHTMNAIIDEKLIIPQLIDTDEDHIRTAVRELRNGNAVVLLEGHQDNLNYNNYMVSMVYSDWKTHKIKEMLSIIKEITSIGVDVKNTIS